MLWFLLALIAAISQATHFMLIKRYLKDVDLYLLAGGSFLFTFALVLPISAINGFPHVQEGFLPYFLITTVMEIIATILYFKALLSTDMSLCLPMLSFTPAFLILTSFLILGESPTHFGIFGILLIVVGSYVLNLTRSPDILLPTKEIFRNRGTLYMLIVAALFSFESNFIKIAVLRSDPFFTLTLFSLLLGTGFLVIALLKKEDVSRGLILNPGTFAILGLVTALEGVSTYLALTLAIVPYVISIKRLTVLFSVIYGGFIFKEKGMKKRLLGASIMVAGSAIVLLF